nr:integrase, catalytic region, zinc finger, CCHC-type, peptidase aspartic, catalytic [Tanacetum cinerariifolium]
EIVDNAWIKHSKDQFRAPTAQDMEILIQTCLMPLAIKTQNDSEIDELKSDKAEFSNMYDVILQECVSNDDKCSYLLSLSNLDALDELECLYLHKVKECDCLAQKLSKQTESVSKEVHNELLQRFAKVKKHSISLEIALQKCKEQHMTDNLKLLCNFVEKFMGTVRFGNDQFTPILGYGDLVQGNVTINRVYYVEGLNHNLYSVGQFCDMDLEVAFRKSTCFVTYLQGNNLLTDKMKEKGDMCILVGYSTQSKGYRVYNKITKMIIESIHIRFDEIKEVSETSVANDTSGLVPQRQKASDYDNPDPVP